MKTVAELAREKNVSVQTIYRKLRKVEQINGKSLTVKQGGITYVTEVGEKFVNEKLTPVEQEPVKILNNMEQAESEEITYLREQNKALLDELNKEREHSRQQADRLANIAEQLAELSKNNQFLLGAEQSRTNPALLMGDTSTEQPTETPKKKGFFGFLKK